MRSAYIIHFFSRVQNSTFADWSGPFWSTKRGPLWLASLYNQVRVMQASVSRLFILKTSMKAEHDRNRNAPRLHRFIHRRARRSAHIPIELFVFFSRNKKKYYFRCVNKIFWVAPIFAGRSREGKQLIFYYTPNRIRLFRLGLLQQLVMVSEYLG